MPFKISTVSPDEMTDEAVLTEATELRIAIADSQGELAEHRANAAAKGALKSKEHLTWLAGARKFQMLLQARITRIRPRERDINIARHRAGK